MSSILVVCHGNVCRSVYGQLLLRARLAGVHPEVRVESAGVDADPGLLRCALVSERAAELGLAADRHVPRPLRREHVEAADLVLCATVAQRSAVALLQPDARNRTFTIREAGLLAGWDRTHGSTPAGSPAELAARLRVARGRVPAPPAVRIPRRWWSRPAAALDPWDIADGHHERPATHLETLAMVEAAVEDVALALGATPRSRLATGHVRPERP